MADVLLAAPLNSMGALLSRLKKVTEIMALVCKLARHLGSIRRDVQRSLLGGFCIFIYSNMLPKPQQEEESLLGSTTFLVCVLMKKERLQEDEVECRCKLPFFNMRILIAVSTASCLWRSCKVLMS